MFCILSFTHSFPNSLTHPHLFKWVFWSNCWAVLTDTGFTNVNQTNMAPFLNLLVLGKTLN